MRLRFPLTLDESLAAHLALVLADSPQAPLLAWIIGHQPEDLVLLELATDGILQIREFPKSKLPDHWTFASRALPIIGIEAVRWENVGPSKGVAPQAWVAEKLPI